MRRIRIAVTYDGTDFHGWQVQPGLATVQGELERVLTEMEGSAVTVHGSGRTDAGVHALAQVAAFDLENRIPVDNLKRAMNRVLARSIRVLSAEEAAPDFHPRFHACAKTYQYRIWREEICPPFDRLYVLHHPFPLDEGAMTDAAPLFQGEHDFTAFAAADERDEEGRSKARTVFSCSLRRDGPRLVFDVRGSGFLKHMVRNLVGTLIEAGRGNISELDRLPEESGATAPAKGLFLFGVEY